MKSARLLTLFISSLFLAFSVLFVPLSATQAQTVGAASGTWTLTGSLNVVRTLHTATLLPDGKVLVAAGSISPAFGTATAELYDPKTGTWTIADSLKLGRISPTSTLLRNGQVLLVGGYQGRNPSLGALNEAELYDPKTGTWTVTGSLNVRRTGHTETLLDNGQVLVAGGPGVSNRPSLFTSTELYNPKTGTWTLTGSLNAVRSNHTATLLRNGEVLVVGGNGPPTGFLASAELYNPETGTWTLTGSLNVARSSFTATLLRNGQVLVVGGFDSNATLASAELYNPETGTWTLTGSLNVARSGHTATLLRNGQVLVAGGFGNTGSLASAELYDPKTGTWTLTGSLNAARYNQTATLLRNSQVLVTGGNGIFNQPIPSAELFSMEE